MYDLPVYIWRCFEIRFHRLHVMRLWKDFDTSTTCTRPQPVSPCRVSAWRWRCRDRGYRTGGGGRGPGARARAGSPRPPAAPWPGWRPGPAARCPDRSPGNSAPVWIWRVRVGIWMTMIAAFLAKEFRQSFISLVVCKGQAVTLGSCYVNGQADIRTREF